jgi:fatty-acyl-CoA synthase
MLSVVSRLQTAAEGTRAITFVGSAAGDAGPADRVEWARLHEDARGMAAALQARGVGAGVHVGVLGPTSRALVTTIQAVFLAGGTVVALPLPMRLGSIEEFVEQTRVRIANADAALVVVDGDLAPFLDSPPAGAEQPAAIVLLHELAAEGAEIGAAAWVRPADDPDRLAILQFTSGSTAAPKGVMLPDRCVGANIDAILAAAQITHADTAVSWLPLYHDMGLIGLLMAPMLHGFELVLGAPQDFLARPACWLEWISEYRGTITAGPNFSYALAARALRRAGEPDLSSWRLALNGAETVDPNAVESFCGAAAPFGFDPHAAYPVFGMAETAIGAAFPRRLTGLVCDTVDREVLERIGVAKQVEVSDPDDFDVSARRLPLLGTAVPGMEMRVVHPVTREDLPERHVGELLLRGTSVTPGYYKREEATAALFHDGWLCTGDLAYLLDGQLVLCGRIKDVIIVGGRNVFPEDIERAVGGLDGVRAGNVIAFGMEGYKGKESVVVVAEVRADDPAAVRDSIHHRTLEVCGLPPRDVMLVQPGSLPKTSSGKLQRAKCRELYLAEELELIG